MIASRLLPDYKIRSRYVTLPKLRVLGPLLNASVVSLLHLTLHLSYHTLCVSYRIKSKPIPYTRSIQQREGRPILVAANTQRDRPRNRSQVYFTTNKIPVPDSALSVATTPTTDTTIRATISVP
jgi:hypothetical protein